MAGISQEAKDRLNKQLEPFSSSSIMNGKNMIETSISPEEEKQRLNEWNATPADIPSNDPRAEVTLNPGEIDALHEELENIGNNGGSNGSMAAEVPAATTTATIEEPPADSKAAEPQTSGIPDEAVVAPAEPEQPAVSADQQTPQAVGKTPAVVEPNGDQPATDKKPSLWSRWFGNDKPAPTESKSTTETPAEPSTSTEEPTEKTPIDNQKLVVEFNDLLNSGNFDQLLGGDEDKKAIIESFATTIMAATDVKALRTELMPQLLKRLRESGRFKSKDELAYVAGKANELMNTWLGEDSSDGTIFFATGGSVAPGDKEYQRYKNSNHEKKENDKQKKALSRFDTVNDVREQAGSTGKVSLATLDTNTEGEPAMTNETEASEGIKPPVEETTPVITDETYVESPIGNNRDGEQNGMAAAPEVAPEPIEKNNAEAVPDVAGDGPGPEDASEDTAAPEPEIVPPEASPSSQENNNEQDMARAAELTKVLNEAVTDEIKGLTAEQVQQLSEASKLIEKYSQDSDSAIIALNESAEHAFTHQENFLVDQSEDSWEKRRQSYIDLMIAYNPSLNVEDPEVSQALEDKVTEKLGEKPKAYEEKSSRTLKRKHKLEIKSARTKQSVESKRQQGAEVTRAAVDKTINTIGKGVGEVMAVPDHVRSGYDITATAVANQVDRVVATVDKSINRLGTAGDIAAQFVVGMPDAVSIGFKGIAIAIDEVSEDIEANVAAQIGKGVEAVKEAIKRRLAKMKENSQKNLEIRRESRAKLEEKITQAEDLIKEKQNNSRGLLGFFKRLRNR